MVMTLPRSSQERSHADTPEQEAVRVQGGGLRKVVLRRPILAATHGEPPQPAGIGTHCDPTVQRDGPQFVTGHGER